MAGSELDGIDIHRYGYPIQLATITNNTPISNAEQPPFLGTFDDLSLVGNEMDVLYHRIQSQAETTSGVDPRLLMLLEFSRGLYSRRSELFKKLFPGLRDGFMELIKRIDAMLLEGKLNHLEQTQVRSLQRSLSVGSPRTPSTARGGEEDFRLKRFKVRTLVVGGGDPGDGGGGGGGQSDTKNGGAN
ncbi:hypothetical protein HS088_TW21G01594 [Tripterygium wilfordii]|uniref:Uncharacterized protein n=1 Tax=Tripterygium wilfordii TaxID=458696 RepID=A0A7J7C5L7_TRIWF|nr:uncharacterized protein LOC119987633 [Tripterygium wilfordii]KAF5729429.1 hypothetical protein HS088_TW21G01594 [Tripterygium wilfordii]